MSFLYFVSYARANRATPRDEEDLRQFIADLRSDVSQLNRPVTAEVDFFDGDSIETGSSWPDELAEALRTSRVCVALYSPSYFDSKWCGREYQAFCDRCKNWEALPANKGKRADVILPILWIPAHKLPNAVDPKQFEDLTLPASYREHGLRQVMRLNRFKDDYWEFVNVFAKKIVDAAIAAPLTDLPHLKSFANLSSAFDEKPAVGAAPSGVTGGVTKACFVFLAGPRAEVSAIRAAQDYYGDEDGWDWKPYLPEDPEPVGALAQQVAGQMGLRFQELACDETLPDRLREAKKNFVPIVMIADAWSAQLPAYRDLLAEYDDLNLTNCAVLVPWNENDAETAAQRDHLRKALRKACPQKTALPPPNHLWESITSAPDLRSRTVAVLDDVRMRLMQLLLAQAGEGDVRRVDDAGLRDAATQEGISTGSQPHVQNTQAAAAAGGRA